uniref:Mitochondrial genome maintenance exonuclease 1 n=1 Tax=Caenorhabditis japonica TaxID=281687 RepID=A0A8R1DHR6_CAEJA
MTSRKLTIRYGTSLMPFFAKQIDAIGPTEADLVTSTLFPDQRIAENPESAKLRRPSLSMILSAIGDNKALYLWQKTQIEEMGLGTFKSNMFERMGLGRDVHSKVEEMLKIRGEQGKTEADIVKLIDSEKNAAIRNFMKSALEVILNVQSPELAICEQRIRHPKLAYQGRFDAVVKYNDNWCMLDWKTAPARSSFSKQGDESLSYETYVRQLAAYAAAYNHDIRFENLPIAKQGILVSLKEDGSSAEVYQISSDEMEKTLAEIIIRLKVFWSKLSSSKGANVDFAYKPDN